MYDLRCTMYDVRKPQRQGGTEEHRVFWGYKPFSVLAAKGGLCVQLRQSNMYDVRSTD
jgi:hypothetical protein